MMMGSKFGDYAWAIRTGGRLTRAERLRQIYEGVCAKIAARFARGAPPKLPDLRTISPPDTALCQAALALCQSASSPALVNHAYRGYMFAKLLDPVSTSVDDEALFTSFLLHDLGLTERYRISRADWHCFTLPGAEAAIDLIKQQRLPDALGLRVADAICLHLNVIVRADHGREAQLLRLGSGADVAGIGLQHVPREVIDALVQRYPRAGLKAELHQSLGREHRQHPQSRIGLLCGSLGFHGLIKRAPFAE
jgi:hypothetical protein